MIVDHAGDDAGPQQPAARPRTAVPVSIVSADRMCTGCGHNLYGQNVVREPHYELLIARCPECGAAAAMQEYPLLGRWAGRIGAVLAALCLLLAIAATFGSAGALGAMSYGIGNEFGQPLTEIAQVEFDRWATINRPGKVSWQVREGPEGMKWWADQGGLSGFVAAHGGWLAIVDWRMAFFWIPAAVAAFGIGCFWSVALLGMRRRKAWKFAVLLFLLASAVVAFAVFMDTTGRLGGGWLTQVYVQRRLRIGGGMAMATLVVLMPVVVAGLWIGRSLARAAATIFLPPRFRGVLSILWTADGMEFPRRGR